MIDKIRPFVLLALIALGIIGCIVIETEKKKESVVVNKIIEDDRSQFEKAFKVVLNHEGGYSNDKHDNGGATSYGISLGFLTAEKIDIDGDNDVDIEDVKILTKDQSKEIYYKWFWKRNNIDDIDDTVIAVKVFDMAVNMGGYQANKILKMALNDIYEEVIPVTGILDNETLSIVNDTEPGLLLGQLRQRQADFYRAIVAKNPKQKKFLKGWLRRAEF